MSCKFCGEKRITGKEEDSWGAPRLPHPRATRTPSPFYPLRYPRDAPPIILRYSAIYRRNIVAISDGYRKECDRHGDRTSLRFARTERKIRKRAGSDGNSPTRTFPWRRGRAARLRRGAEVGIPIPDGDGGVAAPVRSVRNPAPGGVTAPVDPFGILAPGDATPRRVRLRRFSKHSRAQAVAGGAGRGRATAAARPATNEMGWHLTDRQSILAARIGAKQIAENSLVRFEPFCGQMD